MRNILNGANRVKTLTQITPVSRNHPLKVYLSNCERKKKDKKYNTIAHEVVKSKTLAQTNSVSFKPDNETEDKRTEFESQRHERKSKKTTEKPPHSARSNTRKGVAMQ